MRLLLALLLCAATLTLAPRVFAGYSLDADHATFRVNDSLSYVEVYAAIQKNALFYSEQGDTLTAAFSLILELLDHGKPFAADTFAAAFSTLRADSARTGAFFPHVFGIVAPAGRYDLVLSLYQQSLRERLRDTLWVETYTQNQLRISDLELGCYMGVDSGGPSKFTKNSIYLVPNAPLFWGNQLPMAYYYAEIYGLDYDPAQPDSYVVLRQVVRAEDNKVLLKSRVVRAMKQTSGVVADGFPVATLRTGSYYLDLSVQTFRSAKMTSQRKKFWTYREGDFGAGRPVVADRELQNRLLASAPNIIEIIAPDSALNLMRYILTSDEQSQIDQLTDEGKRNFLREYWLRQEAVDPGAGNRYFARIAEANRRYKLLHRAGWKTDRGRVFIMYGEPDQIERNNTSYSAEVWHFDRLEGGVIFAFVDLNEYGDMELIHSTKRGEIYNPSWETQVTGRRTTTPANSNIFENPR